MYAASCLLALQGIDDPTEAQLAGALHEVQHRHHVDQLLRALVEQGGGKMKTW